MKTRLLRKVQKEISATPQFLNMYSFHGNCGTTHCIGGWGEIIEMGTSNRNTDYTRLFGLTNPQASRLFYLGNWPTKLYRRYLVCTKPSSRAKVANERIDLFIATKGAQ